MKSKLTLLLLLVVFFTSCKKTTNVDVEISTSGKLTYKFLDDAGKGLANIKVSLYTNPISYYSSSKLLDTKITDATGLADFGALNPNEYYIIADSAKINNISYKVQEYVQVITGGGKNKEVKVTDFSGNFKFTVRSNYNSQPLKNIGIALIPEGKFNSSLTTPMQLKVSDFKGITDENGNASFKIPSDMIYAVYLYNSVTNASYNNYNGNISAQKDATLSQIFYIYQP